VSSKKQLNLFEAYRAAARPAAAEELPARVEARRAERPTPAPPTPEDRRALLSLRYSSADVAQKNAAIHRQVLAERTHLGDGNYGRISTADLRRLLELYDHQFFAGLLHRFVEGRLSFRLSRRMTSVGGQTTYRKRAGTLEICLSTTLMFQTFDEVQREVRVNGVACHDRLEATMRVFEHELVHLLEFVLFHESSCSGKRFRQLSRNLFGHTAQTHQLVTQRERAWKSMGLHIGSKVSFEFEGRRLTGTIYRITKRATVMVPDPRGPYTDQQQNRYSKYYIPLEWLKAAGG
jgi:hypothetical protein